MKRLGLALAFCLMLIGSSFAQGGMGPGPGTVHSTGSVSFSLNFAGSSSDTAGGTTTTYTSVAIGAADTNRIVAVGVAVRVNADVDSISSMTIGGISATQVAGARSTRADAGLSITDIWYAAVPTGTTANIVINWSASVVRSGIGAYRIITATPAPTSVSFGIGTGTNATTGTITVPGGGAGFAIFGNRNGTGSVAWTNATGDFNLFPSGNYSVGGAKFTATNTITGTEGVSGAAISGAAWQ